MEQENAGTPLERQAPYDFDAVFRFFGRVTSDLIVIFDRSGHILFTNAAAKRVLGCEPEECYGDQLFDFVHPEDRVGARAAFERWSKENAEALLLIETRVVCRVGELRHLHWTVAPFRDRGGETGLFVSHARDVTLLVQAAERVHKSEIRHRSVLSSMLDPIVTIDSQGTVREASRSVEEVFGYTPEDLIGRNVSVLMTEPHTSQHDAYLDHYRRTGETGILGRTRLFDVRHKNGAVFPCELSVSRVDIPGQAEPLFVGSFRDVSARLRAEHALAESEARMRAIFDQEYEFVGLLACDGRLLEVNHSALRGIGARREDVVGRPFWETPWWSRTSTHAERVRQAVATAAAGQFVRFELEFIDAEGQQRWVDFSLKPVHDGAGAVQFLLPEGRDITRLKAVHARELAMQDALAQIGESASLLAHEIKNPLTAVNLALRAVADKLGEDQKSVLEDLSGRLAKLEVTMRRTLSFARPLRLEREPCAADELLSEVARTLRPQLEAARVALELACERELPPVLVDRRLFEDVLLNLLRNALEALTEGGRVRLSAAREGATHLRLCVEDDGPGIPASVRSELFKPFVTSKPSGTGLGLAIARKVVREHGGEIGVEDGSLGGARFWIRMPLAGDAFAQVRMRAGVSS